MAALTLLPALLAMLTHPVLAVNFPYEDVKLTPCDIGDFSSIAFGNTSAPSGPLITGDAECRPLPGQPNWPSSDEWTRLNASLSGALLRPVPAGAVCYPEHELYDADRCEWLLTNATATRFWINDPLTVLTAWTQGDTCPPFRPGKNLTSSCERGGFPEYVINATTVKHVQIGVNFARNKGLRLIVKNTGHDFNGRSAGAGSLSIWTHYLKGFEELKEFNISDYRGTAARVGAGLEAFELYRAMDQYNLTIVSPGGQTVGAYGGWMAGGGHSVLTSKYGLGADQVISLQAVLADGSFVTVDPSTNADLFYALRGGGPGTYGIVTSAVVKTYPPVHVTRTSCNFQYLNKTTFGNTNSTADKPTVVVHDLEAFWEAINLFYYFGKYVADRGGITYNYLTPNGTNQNYTFTTDFQLPGYSPEEATKFLQPFYDSLNAIGVPVKLAKPTTDISWGSGARVGENDAPGGGDKPGMSRFASRLWPMHTWNDRKLFNKSMEAVRGFSDAGFVFHTVHLTPTEAIGRLPGGVSNAVNPAYRSTFMHATMFDKADYGHDVQAIKDAHKRLDGYVNKIRETTRIGGGAYINEADVQEPNWQDSFFGYRYESLVEIKRERDPWGLFWVPTTPRSETWEVRTADRLPTQNGPLCRVSPACGR